MAFIVKKKIKGNDYYYLQKSERKGKKVKSVCLGYLGKNREEAEKKMKEILEKEQRIGDNKKSKEKSDERTLDEKTKLEKKKEKPKAKISEKLTIDDLSAFCKRKGFVFRSSDIYGGFSGFWDFGGLGKSLFDNIKQSWWKYFVDDNENMVGIDASIISHPRTWKASGHLESFTDVFVNCKKCKKANKVDRFELEKGKEVRCGFCSGELDKESAKDFNLMFKMQVGDEKDSLAYLRPETAQGMFMDFKLIAESSRKKLPLGIAQIGKCFRNEIAPRDFLFRSREFTIGEFEFFIHPNEKKCELLEKRQLDLKLRLLDSETQQKPEAEQKLREITISEMLKEKRLGEWHAYWLAEQLLWFKELGLDMSKLKVREHMKDELSHYSSATFDIDFEYPFGSKEVAGNANRGQYDSTQHEKESNESLKIFDEASGEKVIPRVIEPTFGMERAFLAVLSDAYTWDEKRENIVLKLSPKIAPVKAAIFPIVKNDEKMVKIAREVYEDLKKEFSVSYDESGSVGRRYSRNDEIGTPYCITIDTASLKGKDVTIRDRDDTKQIRVKIKDLRDVLRKLIAGEIKFEKAGKIVETRVKI